MAGDRYQEILELSEEISKLNENILKRNLCQYLFHDAPNISRNRVRQTSFIIHLERALKLQPTTDKIDLQLGDLVDKVVLIDAARIKNNLINYLEFLGDLAKKDGHPVSHHYRIGLYLSSLREGVNYRSEIVD